VRSIGHGISNKGCYNFPAWGLIVCLFIQLTSGTEAATNQTAHAVAELQLRKPAIELPPGYGSFLKDGMLWQGEVKLHGRKWWLGAAEQPHDRRSLPSQWLLFLQATDNDGSPVKGLPWFFYALGNLSLNGHAYQVAWNLDGTGSQARLRVTFVEDRPAMGELKVEGTDIRRLQLQGDRQEQLVCVEDPGPKIILPVDRYHYVQVTVGKTNSAVRFETRLFQPLEVTTTNVAILRSGGPLTNFLSVSRQGRSFRLNCQLLNGAGQTFRPLDQSDPPTFNVDLDGRTIHSDKFEFG